MRILFVDNHPEFTATVVASFLHEHDVVIVPTIAAAKELVTASAFDVVLVDYDLDDGKGDEVVRWLSQVSTRPRVIAVSARATGNAALRAAGADAICSKLEFAKIATWLSPRPRIYADFNGLMASPREPTRSMVPLDTWGSLRDLSNAGIKLSEGTRLVIYDESDEIEDLEANAIAQYDTTRSWWYAQFEEDLAYVPARDRSPVTRFLCLGCRADLGPHALVPEAPKQRYENCPHCGLSIESAIAPA